MPEHDTFDLDAAFRDLERDLGSAGGPGAPAAMHSARRRRRTTVAGLATAAAVVSGAVVVGHSALGDDGAAPAEQPTRMGQLPAPAAFHDADFEPTFVGWESGWFYDDTLGERSPLTQLMNPPCWNSLGLRDGSPHWQRVSKNGMVVSGDHLSAAYTMWAGLSSTEASSQVFGTYLAEADQCAGSERLHDRVWTGGAEAVTYRVPAADGVGGDVYVWFAHAGDKLGVALVGTDRGPLPSDVESRFVDRLMSGVQSSESGGPGILPEGQD